MTAPAAVRCLSIRVRVYPCPRPPPPSAPVYDLAVLAYCAGVRLALLAAAVLSHTAPAVAAEPVLVAIIPNLTGSDSEASAFSVFEDVESALGYFPELRLVPRTEIFSTSAGALGQRVPACLGDIECIAGALHAARVQMGVEIVADLRSPPPLVYAHLIDGRSGRIVAREAGEPSAERLSSLLSRLATNLMRSAGFGVGGVLAVDVTPADAEVSVHESTDAMRRQADLFVLPAGRHVVVGNKDGYEQARAEVHIEEAESTRVQLILRELSEPLYRSPWLWVAVGAVVAGTTAAVFALLPGEDTFRVCQAPDRSQCPGAE